jgi:hypothetical protein
MNAKLCAACDSKNPYTAYFCGNCGKSLEAKRGDLNARPLTRRVKKGVTWLRHHPSILVASCVTLAVAGALAISAKYYVNTSSRLAADGATETPQLPPVSDLGPGLSGIPAPTAPELASPSDKVMAAIRQALSKMDAKVYSSYGSTGVSDTNSRAVFSDLNQQVQGEAIPGLLTLLLKSDDAVDRIKTVKLLEYYISDPGAQKSQGLILNALSFALSLERDSSVQTLLIQVIKDSPVPNDDKFKHLQAHLGRLQDGPAKERLIRALGELAPPQYRDGLAVELTQLLTATQNSDVAAAAADEVKQFGFRRAVPNLMRAVQTAPPSVAAKIAGLLRALTPPNEQERQQLGALMTSIMSQTLDSNLASEAAETIKEFHYQKAAAPMTQLLSTTTNSNIGLHAADVLKSLRYREACPALKNTLATAPLEVAVSVADLMNEFQCKEAIPLIRSRLLNDRFTSSGSIVALGRALYELQGGDSVDLLIQCFREGRSSLRYQWVSLFKEKRIGKAREAVQSVRDSITVDYERKQVDDYLKDVSSAATTP